MTDLSMLGNNTSGSFALVAMACSHGWTRTHSAFVHVADTFDMPFVAFTLDSRCDIPRRNYWTHVINMMIETTKITKTGNATTVSHKQLQLICSVTHRTLWSLSAGICSLTVPRCAAAERW
jgi:hypothetical protein